MGKIKMSDLQRRIEALTRSNANLLALLRDVDDLSDRVRNAERAAFRRRLAARADLGHEGQPASLG
jgi:hypothetical protein